MSKYIISKLSAKSDVSCYIKREDHSEKRISWMLNLICFFSNLSQLPLLFRYSASKNIIITMWVLLILYVLYKNMYKLKTDIKFVLITLLLFDLVITIFQIYTGDSYLKSSMIYPVHLSFFVLLTSYFTGQICAYDTIKKLSFYYVMGALVAAVYVYFDAFAGMDWVGSVSYLYTSKNSLGQILLIAMILLFFFPMKRKAFQNSIIAFFLLMLVMLRSRATLLGLFCVVLYAIYFLETKVKRKVLYTILLGLGVFLVAYNQSVYDFIINSILLGNKAGSGYNLNDISSGRMQHFEWFGQLFNESPIYGHGSKYLESFPLAALASYGLIGAAPLFVLAVSPLIYCFIYRRDTQYRNLNHLIVSLSIVILSNAIFEELAPFGPGVKCYFLWLMTGLYIGLKQRSPSEQDKSQKTSNHAAKSIYCRCRK